MIYINMRNYAYNKEIFELIRAFYPREEIVQAKEQVSQGIYIDFLIENSHGISKIFINDSLVSTARVNIDEIYINRPRDKSMELAVKKSLFIALKKATKKNLSWGVLTGVRPIKIVRRLIEKNTPANIIKSILTKEYMIDEDRANLLIYIADMQKDYIYPLDKDKYSLYVGIPYCPTRCKYCSFSSIPINRQNSNVDEYVEKLIYEIKSTSSLLEGMRLNTIYIGGGTPTSIPIKSLEQIIKTIYKWINIENLKEFTVEAGRPETINKDILKMLKDYKVDRISINPQSMNDNTLKLIGRNHSSYDIFKAYHMAKEVGFKTINMDLIIGLPGEDVEDIQYTLDHISKLSPENLTVHTLAIKKGSKYGDSGDKSYIDSITGIEEMLNLTKSFCMKYKYNPYYLYRQKQILGNLENIGYAKSGKESIYNIAIMEERESIIGLGVGSTTKVYNPKDDSLNRMSNFKDLKSYLERTDEIISRKRKLLMKNMD